MSLDIVVFKAIDYIYKPFQNRAGKVRKYRKTVNSTKNIIYDKTKPDICVLDTYETPTQSNEKRPLIFNIHGGGFVAGDKKYREHLCSWFAAETNAFVVNINYGLGPKYHYEDAMRQIITAINWVYDNANKYNLDLTKSIITGDSSGGYFAAATSIVHGSKLMQEILGCCPKFQFKGIMLNCGIYDINQALSTKVAFNITDKVCVSFTGHHTTELNDYEYGKILSPIQYLTNDFPKACVIYAKKDIFCRGQGELLVDKLKKNNVYYEELYSTKFVDNHTFQSTWNSKMAKKANGLFIDFAKRVIKGEI